MVRMKPGFCLQEPSEESLVVQHQLKVKLTTAASCFPLHRSLALFVSFQSVLIKMCFLELTGRKPLALSLSAESMGLDLHDGGSAASHLSTFERGRAAPLLSSALKNNCCSLTAGELVVEQLLRHQRTVMRQFTSFTQASTSGLILSVTLQDRPVCGYFTVSNTSRTDLV